MAAFVRFSRNEPSKIDFPINKEITHEEIVNKFCSLISKMKRNAEKVYIFFEDKPKAILETSEAGFTPTVPGDYTIVLTRDLNQSFRGKRRTYCLVRPGKPLKRCRQNEKRVEDKPLAGFFNGLSPSLLAKFMASMKSSDLLTLSSIQPHYKKAGAQALEKGIIKYDGKINAEYIDRDWIVESKSMAEKDLNKSEIHFGALIKPWRPTFSPPDVVHFLEKFRFDTVIVTKACPETLKVISHVKAKRGIASEIKAIEELAKITPALDEVILEPIEFNPSHIDLLIKIMKNSMEASCSLMATKEVVDEIARRLYTEWHFGCRIEKFHIRITAKPSQNQPLSAQPQNVFRLKMFVFISLPSKDFKMKFTTKKFRRGADCLGLIYEDEENIFFEDISSCSCCQFDGFCWKKMKDFTRLHGNFAALKPKRPSSLYNLFDRNVTHYWLSIYGQEKKIEEIVAEIGAIMQRILSSW